MRDLKILFAFLKTAKSVHELNKNREEIAEFIPDVRSMFQFDQKNSAHQYDLWIHSLHTVMNLPRDLEDDMLYLAALLHDIGKTSCGTFGEDGEMHYKGHPEESAHLVEQIVHDWVELDLLSEKDAKRLVFYVEHHDDRIETTKEKFMHYYVDRMISWKTFQNLMLLEAADAKAHVMLPLIEERYENCLDLSNEKWKETYKKMSNKNVGINGFIQNFVYLFMQVSGLALVSLVVVAMGYLALYPIVNKDVAFMAISYLGIFAFSLYLMRDDIKDTLKCFSNERI